MAEILGALLGDVESVTPLCMFDETSGPNLFNALVALAPLKSADRAKVLRDAIKAAGGAEYGALLEKERAARARYREKNPGYWRKGRKPGWTSNRMGIPFRTYLCSKARQRGRKRGLQATITPDDLIWPSHCPVLGIELDYPTSSGERKDMALCANWPSLDRWDNTKGYVPGNVFVISMRANTLKNSATYEEILKVAKYLSRRPR